MKKVISVLFLIAFCISAIGQSKKITTINQENKISTFTTNNAPTISMTMGNVLLRDNLIKWAKIPADTVNKLEINSFDTAAVPILKRRNNSIAANNSNGKMPVMEIEYHQDKKDTINNLVIGSYYVEETINMKFGKTITKYEVSRLDMISTYDLGPNNTRIITPKYIKVKVNKTKIGLHSNPIIDSASTIIKPIRIKEITATKRTKPSILANGVQSKNSIDSTITITNPVKVGKTNTAKTSNKIIDILQVYKNVLEKGYKSIEKLKKTADQFYQDGNIPEAAKYYSQLFKIVKDLTTVTKQAKLSMAQSDLQSKNILESKGATIKPFKIEENAIGKTINNTIDVLELYKKVLDKGYKSTEMLKKVGDQFYYDGDMSNAVKYYSQLFNITKDLESEYYYRYAQSLKATNQIDAADEIMKLFQIKTK